jgi:sulfur-carrier protein
MRPATDGEAELSLDAPTVGQLIADLEQRYPAMQGRLRDDTGELRRFVNLYLNGEDVRFKDGLRTSLQAGDELSIVPAVAGG